MCSEKKKIIVKVTLTHHPYCSESPYYAGIEIYLPADKDGNLIEDFVLPATYIFNEELNPDWGELISPDEGEDVKIEGNMRVGIDVVGGKSAEEALRSAFKIIWVTLQTLRSVAEVKRKGNGFIFDKHIMSFEI